MKIKIISIVITIVLFSLSFCGCFEGDNNGNLNPEKIDRRIPEPQIEIIMDKENKTLFVESVGLDDSNWKDFHIISVDDFFWEDVFVWMGNASLPSGNIKAGDIVKNCSGIVVLFLNVHLGCHLGKWDFTSSPYAINISTDKNKYYSGENVTIFMTNILNITLKQGYNWDDFKIKNESGHILYYTSFSSYPETVLNPGDTVSIGVWEQKNKTGIQVQAGSYVIEKEYAGFIDTAEITIQ